MLLNQKHTLIKFFYTLDLTMHKANCLTNLYSKFNILVKLLQLISIGLTEIAI